MSNQITVLILNTEEELKSFPLNQSIKLKFSDQVEDSQLKNCISLIRNLSETGLFNISERYNQSIGYIREKFDIEDIDIKTELMPDGYIVTVTPTKPLHPSFDYTLFIDKELSKEFLSVTKPVSKSKSEIKVSVDTTTMSMYDIEIISDPSLSDTTNTIKVQYTDIISNKVVEKSINLKRTRQLKINSGITISFVSDVYLKGEKFEIRSDLYKGLEHNFLISIRTSTTEDVKPINTEENFKRVTNEDILNYYKTLKPQQSNTTHPNWFTNTNNVGLTPSVPSKDPNEIQVEVIGKDKVRLTLPEGVTTDDIDLDGITFEHTYAFNMYTLDQFGLYNPDAKYSMTKEVESESVIVLTFKEIK